MLILVLITYWLNLLDLYFTTMLVDKFGLDIEANPIGKFLLKDYKLAFFVKVIAVGISLFLLYFLHLLLIGRIIIWVLFIIFTLLSIYHFIIILYLKINKLWI
ncbi:MAG: hypothetical protein GX802_02865 [Clostridiales bacterium]|jgi:hypothetical protein|nr:hypothetical protein [Clostridiales bacterium]